ncbi:MAG: HAMP domain-containing sensor histidine kinase [Chloroflexota bacterium]
MTQPHQPASDELGEMLKRVHMLGSATENLFNRLYSGLNRRKELSEALAELDNMDVRNRKLREALAEKSIETQRLTAILASISEGIIMQDTEGRIVMMNSAAQKILGSSRTFWSSELGILFRESRHIPSVGSDIVPVSEAKRVDINERTVSAQIASISDDDNERIGTLMILRDVTDELSERMKHSFVTHMSHEIKTPLNPLRLASEVLLNTPEGQAPNRRMLEMIGRNVDVLDRLITEMLDMSAMTSGDFQIKQDQVLLEDVIFEVVDGLTPDIQKGDLELFLMLKDSDDLVLTGDLKNLRWAFSNILRNAIQYTLSGGEIWVAAGIDRQQDDHIILEVTDTGVGISQDDVRYVFDLFYRGDARAEDGTKLDPRGLGQGLFVARTVAEAHGGHLLVETEQYEGTTFRMILPRNLPPALPS